VEVATKSSQPFDGWQKGWRRLAAGGGGQRRLKEEAYDQRKQPANDEWSLACRRLEVGDIDGWRRRHTAKGDGLPTASGA
jgi:hypothetical protein